MTRRHDSSTSLPRSSAPTPRCSSLGSSGLSGETIAHVLTVVRRGFADRRRSATATETSALNQICLDETPEREPYVLAEMLRQDVHTAVDVVFPKIGDDRTFPFHGGVTTTMTPALHVVLGEFVLHGYDVARAVDRPFRITEREALLLVPGELFGAWLRADAPDEVYELRLGHTPPVQLQICGGRLAVAEGPGGTVIAMDPIDFVLAFYGREPTNDEALTTLRSRFVPA